MFMYINTLRLSTLIIYSSKTIFLCNFTHHLFSQNTSNFSSRCQQFSTRRGGRFLNQLCNITAKPNKNVHPIALSQIYIVYWNGFNIGIGALQGNSYHRKISKDSWEAQ